jgi:sugar phosphate isomerase/epimerase
MTLRDRIGVDVGRRLAAEDAVKWAAGHAVRRIDVQIDLAPNALESFDAERCRAVRALAERHGVALGLHTLSAVNIAEISPFVREAADAYLNAYVDAAARLNADAIVVHAGYHFTADRAERMTAALERLRRAADYAERVGVILLLENLNREPVHAEVNYLGHTLEEWAWFYDRIDSPSLRLSVTANHAHMMPEGVVGWIDAIPIGRVDEVRLADNHGEYEIHMKPGEGTMDFGAMFKRLEERGFAGHFTNAWGTLDDMLVGRDVLVDRAREAGCTVD